MFKCLQGIAIPHFASYITKVDSKHNKRGNQSRLHVPKVRTEDAKKSFMVQGPACFNRLPAELQTLNSLTMFNHKLKEHLLNN